MNKITSIAVSLILFVVLGSLIASDFYIPEPVDAQERPLAIVRRFKPSVELAGIDKETIVLSLEENIGEQLFHGDTLETNTEGYALVVFMDNSIAKVKPESQLIVRGQEQPNSKNTTRRINLDKGEIFLEVEPQGSGTFEISTSRSLASVKGTRFGSTAQGYVWVEEGQVDVTATNSGETVSLFQQMYAEVDETGNSIDSGTLTTDEVEDLQEGYETLDEDMIEKTIIIRFRDVNGQIREVPITIFEKGN
ncbi:MAG: FecR domain-containing protein [Balneolaceae bacterium]|nr:FecR domain-containing protein [Balneolaceae bacterium]